MRLVLFVIVKFIIWSVRLSYRILKKKSQYGHFMFVFRIIIYLHTAEVSQKYGSFWLKLFGTREMMLLQQEY